MKRLGLLLTIVCLLGISTANAQNTFGKGDCTANLMIGVGSGLPVSGSMEWPIVSGLIKGRASIGLGPYVGFRIPLGTNQVGCLDVSARAAFHYQFVEKLDTYVGLGLGMWGTFDGKFGAGLGISGYLGARYYFWDNIGLCTELGYGISYFSIGACFKL